MRVPSRRLASLAAAALCFLMSLPVDALAQPDALAAPTFAQRLGWGADDVVVILHIDDVGMSRSSNAGAVKALEQGAATSCAVMMPCPWVPEIAAYLRDHPDIDAGLHLTLTSEWDRYRWGPVAGKPVAPSLVDPEGCLWSSVAQVVARAAPDQIEIEIRAQIDRAEQLRIPITHMDSHMGTLFAHPAFFERYVKVGVEKGIPILAVGGHMTWARQENPAPVNALRRWIPRIWNAGLPVIDDLHTGSYNWPAEEKPERLVTLLESLSPGVTEILFHASEPTDVFPLITGSSASRKGDLDALLDKGVQDAIERRGIILTTWRELAYRRRAAEPIAIDRP